VTDPLRDAAQAVVDLTDDLARWDEMNRYVVNSERDYLAGNLDAAWDRLRAALAATPAPALDVERLARALIASGEADTSNQAMHVWRCQHPDYYPELADAKCGCVEESAAAIARAYEETDRD
jgi:hypothetical protein